MFLKKFPEISGASSINKKIKINIKNVPEKEKFFIGIDLGGKTKISTGLCILESYKGGLRFSKKYCKKCQDLRYKELFEALKPYLRETGIIVIDGPLTLGKGKGLMRLYEKFLLTKTFREIGISPLPPALMPSLTEVGRELVEKLKEHNFVLNSNLIETFSDLVKELCHKNFVVNVLNKEALILCQSANQKEALVCAVVAWLHYQSKTRNLGYKDGLLFLPEMSFWRKEWREKFYQAWMARNRLKYKYLTTNIFDKL